MVTIEFETSSGMEQETLDSEDLEIVLTGESIVRIDLRQFEQFVALEELDLSLNHIEEIDLHPLMAHQSLRELVLCENELYQIDLSPLAQCPKLEVLDLYDNRLKRVDLSPIRNCRGLKELYLGHNRITKLDMSPLSALAELKSLDLGFNMIGNLDLAPLSSCMALWEVGFNYNMLEFLDLSPLTSHDALTYLYLEQRTLETLDVTPLLTCTALEGLTVGRCRLVVSNPSGASEAPRWLRLHRRGLILPEGQETYARSPYRRIYAVGLIGALVLAAVPFGHFIFWFMATSLSVSEPTYGAYEMATLFGFLALSSALWGMRSEFGANAVGLASVVSFGSGALVAIMILSPQASTSDFARTTTFLSLLTIILASFALMIMMAHADDRLFVVTLSVVMVASMVCMGLLINDGIYAVSPDSAIAVFGYIVFSVAQSLMICVIGACFLTHMS